MLSVWPANVTTSFALIDHSFHRTRERFGDAIMAARKFSSRVVFSKVPAHARQIINAAKKHSPPVERHRGNGESVIASNVELPAANRRLMKRCKFAISELAWIKVASNYVESDFAVGPRETARINYQPLPHLRVPIFIRETNKDNKVRILENFTLL